MGEVFDRTIVEEFARRARRRAVLLKWMRVSVFVSFFGTAFMVSTSSYPLMLWPSIAVLVVVSVAVAWGKFDWRCPSCRHFLPSKGEPLGECPRCHVAFVDGEVEGQGLKSGGSGH